MPAYNLFPMLRLRPPDAVAASVAGWVFPLEAAGQDMHVEIDFNMNCQQKDR